jgi:hypothetical protein
MERGYYSGGTLDRGKTIPLRTQNHTTNPGAFTLNGDGTVTVNQTGIYLLTSRIQSFDNNDVNGDGFAIQIDGSNYPIPQLKSTITPHGGNNVTGVTTVHNLNAGQKLSIAQTKGYSGGGTVLGGLFGGLYGGALAGRGGQGGANLTPAPGSNPVDTPTAALTVTRVG